MAQKQKKSKAKLNKKPQKRNVYTKTPNWLTNLTNSQRKWLGVVVVFVFALIGVWLLQNSFANTTFKHPGVLVSKEQLAFVKDKVNKNEQPWKAAFDQMKGDFKARTTYTPKPVPRLQCTTSSLLTQYQQLGCTDINNDSAAVYTLALMWQMTGDKAYADTAIKIMNAWSSTLKEAPLDDPNGTDPKNDAEFWQSRLILGWSAESIVRGAEIIKHGNIGWQSADITRFDTMLKNIYVPHLSQGWTGSNNGAATWADGLINIGVFLNDKTIFDRGIEHWKYATRSMIYQKSIDGAVPQDYFTPRYNKFVKISYGATSYIDGLAGETCRDIGHTFMGLGALANGAETAYLNGVDLYSDPEFKSKLINSFELNSNYTNQMLDQMAATGQTAKQVTDSGWKPTNFPCPDFKDGGGSAFLGHEIALNHYANRLKISMPNTTKLAERTRPQKGGNHLFWETLTHAKTGNVGIVSTPEPVPEPADIKAPTVAITNPSANAALSGPANIAVNAADESGISKVEIKLNGQIIATKTAAPYTYTLNTTTSANGAYVITAVAYDTKNNSASSSVQVTIKNVIDEPAPAPTPVTDTKAPSIPTNLTKSLAFNWSGPRYDIVLNWTASTDNTGVKEYRITRNGQLLGTTTTAKFQDTTASAGVQYQYTISALDTAGNISQPATISAKANCFLLWCSVQ